MQFKKFSAGTHAYGTDQIPTEKQEENVSFSDPNMMRDLTSSSEENHEALRRVVLFLACCHTIIID